MSSRYDAIMRWPVPPDFIEAIYLKRQCQRIGKWALVRTVLQADPDVWEDFIFQGGISTRDLAEHLSDALGIERHRIAEFAKEAVARGKE